MAVPGRAKLDIRPCRVLRGMGYVFCLSGKWPLCGILGNLKAVLLGWKSLRPNATPCNEKADRLQWVDLMASRP